MKVRYKLYKLYILIQTHVQLKIYFFEYLVIFPPTDPRRPFELTSSETEYWANGDPAPTASQTTPLTQLTNTLNTNRMQIPLNNSNPCTSGYGSRIASLPSSQLVNTASKYKSNTWNKTIQYVYEFGGIFHTKHQVSEIIITILSTVSNCMLNC